MPTSVSRRSPRPDADRTCPHRRPPLAGGQRRCADRVRAVRDDDLRAVDAGVGRALRRGAGNGAAYVQRLRARARRAGRVLRAAVGPAWAAPYPADRAGARRGRLGPGRACHRHRRADRRARAARCRRRRRHGGRARDGAGPLCRAAAHPRDGLCGHGDGPVSAGGDHHRRAVARALGLAGQLRAHGRAGRAADRRRLARPARTGTARRNAGALAARHDARLRACSPTARSCSTRLCSRSPSPRSTRS